MGDEEGLGAAYRVEYLDGEREGKDGSLTWIARAGRARVRFGNGDEFEGNFNDLRQRHGAGTYTYAGSGAGGDEEEEDADEGKSGAGIKAQFTGDFRFGKKHGTGKMRYPDGGVYTGGWASDQREGTGTYYYPNGDIFTGRWSGGRKQGRGSYTYALNGSKLAGTWENDVFSAGKWVQMDNTSYHGSFSGHNPTGSGCFYFPRATSSRASTRARRSRRRTPRLAALARPDRG